MEALAASSPAIPRLVPYAAGGDLAYGGRLHALLAGSIYAGTLAAKGYCSAVCGDALLLSRCSRGDLVELYYVEPETLRLLDKHLASLGAERKTIPLRHGGIGLRAEAHVASDCRPVDKERGGNGEWRRLLLVLPPQAPPPATPMAVYTAVVDGVSACSGEAFCRDSGSSEAAVADIVVSEKVLSSWLSSLGASLSTASARLSHSSLVVYVHVPVRENRGG